MSKILSHTCHGLLSNTISIDTNFSSWGVNFFASCHNLNTELMSDLELVCLSVLDQNCVPSKLFCIRIVLPQNCVASELFCIKIVLHQNCLSVRIDVSFVVSGSVSVCPSVLDQNCVASKLFCLKIVLHQNCVASELSLRQN